jgi:arginine exporter protein ArgO
MNDGTFIIAWIVFSALWFVGCVINLVRLARTQNEDGKLQDRIINGVMALLCTPAAFILIIPVAFVLFLILIIEVPSKLIYKVGNRNA